MKFSLSRLFEYALWLLGFACLGIFVVAQAQAGRIQADAIAQVELGYTGLSHRTPNMALWSKTRIANYDATAAHDFSPLGILTIPNVNLRTAVFDGTSDAILDVGAGRVAGTAAVAGNGNLAIAAHRDGFFRGLKDIEIGDELLFSNHTEEFRYTVTETLVVEPTDVSVLKATSHPTITLITCYPFYFVGSAPQRFIVRAELSAHKPDSVPLKN